MIKMNDSEIFDRRFLAGFAVYVTTLGILYVFAVTFITVPKDSQQYASTALGFILGTLLAAPLAYFYGASKQRAALAALNPPMGNGPKGTPGNPVSTEEVEKGK